MVVAKDNSKKLMTLGFNQVEKKQQQLYLPKTAYQSVLKGRDKFRINK